MQVDVAGALSHSVISELWQVGCPEDAAGLALFLGSKASGFVTGSTINLDGGTVGLRVTRSKM